MTKLAEKSSLISAAGFALFMTGALALWGFGSIVMDYTGKTQDTIIILSGIASLIMFISMMACVVSAFIASTVYLARKEYRKLWVPYMSLLGIIALIVGYVAYLLLTLPH